MIISAIPLLKCKIGDLCLTLRFKLRIQIARIIEHRLLSITFFWELCFNFRWWKGKGTRSIPRGKRLPPSPPAWTSFRTRVPFGGRNPEYPELRPLPRGAKYRHSQLAAVREVLSGPEEHQLEFLRYYPVLKRKSQLHLRDLLIASARKSLRPVTHFVKRLKNLKCIYARIHTTNNIFDFNVFIFILFW